MSVAENLARVRARMVAACTRCGRDIAEVRIVAVSKTHPVAAIAEAIAAGVDAIGENRVQEAAAKRPFASGTVPWHLVGPLQRNKAKQALDLFDLLETVDRPELGSRLEQLLSRGAPGAFPPPTPAESPPEPPALAGSEFRLALPHRVVPVFLEVNIGGEPQKSGVMPASTPALVEHLLAGCPHLRIEGLMTVPPYDADPERSRPHFARLRRLGAELAQAFNLGPLALSMGMSEDFEVAVEEGASWVRLGRVLFGERRPQA